MLFSQNIILIFHQFQWEILCFMSLQWVKHKHKTVQWVWKSLKLITEAKTVYLNISRNGTFSILYWKIFRKYCIVSFRYCRVCTGSTRISDSILIQYFLMLISNFQKPMQYFPIWDCGFFQSCTCLILTFEK
jgi:hypothetical protein